MTRVCTTMRGDAARRSILIGDDIELPGNVACLRAAAEMVGWQFELAGRDAELDLRSSVRSGLTLIALENTEDANDLFHFRPPDGPLAVVVGNERKGISRRVLRLADRVVAIPVASAQLNTLNVAAAAAVALYQLSRAREGRIGAHGRGRPDLLFAGAGDAIELGSAVRSAACLGWTRLYIDDRERHWFDVDRVTRSLGRGAARRGRNPIHVLPAPDEAAFDEVCLVAARCDGEPLRRADLARGPRQLVIVCDDVASLDPAWLGRLGGRVRTVSLDVPDGQRPPFRLVASIALAEIARQSGRRG